MNAHDFPQDAECRASQYGIYDPERNEGHVCVATSADTADFAVDAINDWWRLHRPDYPQRKRLMIEADGGGSNTARSRRFKKRLQDFADESGLEIMVCHYPPGTSKWNPIEHRLFSQITATWAGFVLSTLAILLGFIRRTTTRTGLKVTATHFEKTYQPVNGSATSSSRTSNSPVTTSALNGITRSVRGLARKTRNICWTGA